jgi:hypothetical protein
VRDPFPLQPHQHLLLVVFLMIAILKWVWWNISVVLICISFIARDGEHFSCVVLVIWTSSFKKVLFSSLAHFFIDSLILGSYVFLSTLYILVINPFSDV